MTKTKEPRISKAFADWWQQQAFVREGVPDTQMRIIETVKQMCDEAHVADDARIVPTAAMIADELKMCPNTVRNHLCTLTREGKLARRKSPEGLRYVPADMVEEKK